MSLRARASSSARATSRRTSSRRSQSRLRVSSSHAQRHLGESLQVHALRAGAGQVSPRLLGGERQQRRHQPGQRGEDLVAHRLGGAPPRVGRGRGVEPVLDDVEVERRQIHRAEVVDGVERRVELVFLVGPRDAIDQPGQPVEDEPIHLVQALVGLAIGAGRRSRRGCRAGTGTCSGSAGRRRPAGRGSRTRQADVLGVVLGGDPQPQDLGAVLRQQVVGETTLPTDFDIFRPSPSTKKPWVSTVR